jgi:CRP-like cAMP-binding protein/thioredoxin reductase
LSAAAPSNERYDLVIVGAGPAGLATAAHAKTEGLAYVLLERAAHLADTVDAYQKRKLVMAEPALVPLRSELPFAAGSREEVLERWRRFAAEQALAVHLGQEVTGIQRAAEGFTVETRQGPSWRAKRVVLAIGTQGNPRRIGVPGEEQPHVTGRLVDPAAHEDEDVVVVGAGDSALEVAIALADRNRVHLVVRSPEIVRAKESLERDVLSRQAAGAGASGGRLEIHFSTTVRQIGGDFVDLEGPEADRRVAAGRVILKLGADPPRKWLEGLGVAFAGEARDARPALGPGFESSVPGLHLIGAVTGRDLIKLGINQGYEVVERVLGRAVEPADEAVLRERLPIGRGTVSQRIDSLRDAVPVLQFADEDALREVFLLSRTLDFKDGQVIVRQNDYTDSFLVIVEGAVAISTEPPGGGERREVAVLSAGNFFGEMGLVSGRRRNATAVARGSVRLLEIPRKAMLKLLLIAPEVKKVVDRTFLVRALGRHIFPEVATDRLWPLAAGARRVRTERGQVLFAEGAAPDAFYLVRNGMVKLSKVSGEREIVLTYLVSGNYFGEGALFEDNPRTATATAIFTTDLIVLDKDVFQRFLESHPQLEKGLAESFERKKLESLTAEALPGAGEVLSQLIETEAVIGTDVLVIDNHKCVRCGNCIAACEGVHDDGQARLSLTGETVANLLLPNSCMQCENPLCMLDCPPDAIVRRPRGEIFIRDNCIGCGNCAANCPYDNIFMVHPKPAGGPFGWLVSLFRSQRAVEQEVAVKCDLCRGVRGGPACVRSCPTGAALRLEPRSPEDLRVKVADLIDPEAMA